MKISYSKQFIKDVKKHSQHKKQIAEIISEFQGCKNIYDLSNIKKLRSTTNDFRMRVGNYRIGFSIEKDTLVFRRFLHRKDIYKYFP